MFLNYIIYILKLKEVGSKGFVEAEGLALLHLQTHNSVISLSGSNPMYKDAMDHIRSLGLVIFLDVQSSDILKRLEQMKISRIVGQEEKVTMAEILEYRQQFYETNYDIRIICEENENPASVAKKISDYLMKLNKLNCFISTRSKRVDMCNSVMFDDVILQGLAPDGGLYVTSDPVNKLTKQQWKRLLPLNYQERALRILEQWIPHNHLHPSILSGMIKKAYSWDNFQCKQIFPVRHIKDNIFLLELFHGPTASFKDAALQLMPQFFAHAAKRQCSQDR